MTAYVFADQLTSSNRCVPTSNCELWSTEAPIDWQSRLLGESEYWLASGETVMCICERRSYESHVCKREPRASYEIALPMNRDVDVNAL